MFTGSSHRCTCPKFKAKRRSFSFRLDALYSFSCLLFFGRNFAPMANHHGIRHPKIIGPRSSSKSPSCKYKFLAQAVEIPRHQHIHPTSTFQFPCQLRSKILLPRVRQVAGPWVQKKKKSSRALARPSPEPTRRRTRTSSCWCRWWRRATLPDGRHVPRPGSPRCLRRWTYHYCTNDSWEGLNFLEANKM